MQIDDDIKPRITRPPAYLFQVVQSTLREMFAVRVDQIFANPVSDRDTDSIKAIRLHLRDIILRGPSVPVVRPNLVSLSLSKLTDAIELRCCTAATHTVPLIVGHPRLDDKLRPEIDTSDWQLAGKPAHGFIPVLAWHDRSLVRVLAIVQKRSVPRRHPCRREASIGRDGKIERPHT